MMTIKVTFKILNQEKDYFYFHKNGEKILTTSEFMMMSFKVKDLLDISTEFKTLNDELDSTELEFFIIEGK